MNVEKYTKDACGHLFAHYERAKDKHGKFVKFGNRDIDLLRSNQNYNLAPNRGMTQNEYLQERLSEVYHVKKKDLNVMCSWVITAPDDLPQEKQRAFFQSAYRFMALRYGEENVISSYVHLDENLAKGHAHMHFAFIPVVYDVKRERFKVSAKEAVSKAELKSIHKDMEVFLAEELDFHVHMLNGRTAAGNKSIKELKECQDKISEAWETVRLLSDKADRLHTLVESQSNELKEIRASKERLIPTYAAGVEVPEVKEKRSLFGQERVELSAEDWQKYTENLLDMASTIEAAADRIDATEKEVAMLQKKEKQYHAQGEEIKNLQKECLSLKKQLAELQEYLHRFIRFILQALPEFQEVITQCIEKAVKVPERSHNKEIFR